MPGGKFGVIEPFPRQTDAPSGGKSPWRAGNGTKYGNSWEGTFTVIEGRTIKEDIGIGARQKWKSSNRVEKAKSIALNKSLGKRLEEGRQEVMLPQRF